AEADGPFVAADPDAVAVTAGRLGENLGDRPVGGSPVGHGYDDTARMPGGPAPASLAGAIRRGPGRQAAAQHLKNVIEDVLGDAAARGPVGPAHADEVTDPGVDVGDH